MARKATNGFTITKKGYPRITAGPLRGKYLHRVIAAAMLGRELTKDEEVDHRNRNKLDFGHTNLVIRGHKEHGWVSAKQAWFMRRKDATLKREWDEFMETRDLEQKIQVSGDLI